MDGTAWLRVAAGAMADPPTGSKAAKLFARGPRLEVEFPSHVLTADTARRVGRQFAAVPDYEALAAALRHVAETLAAADAMPEAETPEQRRGRIWGQWLGDRLRQGADPAHLLSLTRAHAPESERRAIIARHFPAEAQAEDERAAEVRRDKARNAADPAAARARVAAALGAALGNAWRAPPLHAGPSNPPQQPPEPPPAPPEPPPLRLAEQLRRLEVEAASNDPPPNAAARIAALRRKLAGEEAPA
jgi:hypothetical protein